MIPVIDIFAGPGGLGEGFSALTNDSGNQIFKIALSIEKDAQAHETLTLRSFFRQFPIGQAPQEYYDFIKGGITKEDLFKMHSQEASEAKEEAWLAKLGDSNEDSEATPNAVVDKKIQSALKNAKEWLLIGGPPCQAYSIVGRSRRKETILDEESDVRVGLYKQYLRILAVHNPTVFVMENVKGLLSAKTTKENSVFSNILRDLADPVKAYKAEFGNSTTSLLCPGYKIYSLSEKPKDIDLFGTPTYSPRDFLINSENYGIPQTRHRVILLGIRNDINVIPETLERQREVAISKVLSGLPRLRSGLSKSKLKDFDAWKKIVFHIKSNKIKRDIDKETKKTISQHLKNISEPQKGMGAEFIPYKGVNIEYGRGWFLDDKITGVCNHASRSHMNSDINRYFFAACYALTHNYSPKIEDFPLELLPAHINIANAHGDLEGQKFVDRFKVQLWNMPCKTVTSHISKDGHYYIHPDPTQCRSFTVREAARIQTFPDNYFFCGPRTEQYHQVGNAVPPLLARQIAEIVEKLF